MAQRGFGVEAYTEVSQFYFFLKLRARRLLLGYAAKIRKFRSSTDLDKNFVFSFLKHGDPCLNKQASGNTEGRVHNKACFEWHPWGTLLVEEMMHFLDCKASSLHCPTASAGAISAVHAH